MKRIFILLLFYMLCTPAFAQDLSADDIFDIKQNAFALYNTNNVNEAYNLLIKIDESKMDEEVFLILANIEEDKGNIESAIEYLNKAISKKEDFYKPYYNLGCIYMKQKKFSSALNQFEHALKYNKENSYIFYNLGCAQLHTGSYKKAKRNFIKAIYLKKDEKDFYYNLAYANKQLGNEKAAKKVIDFYNSTFVK